MGIVSKLFGLPSAAKHAAAMNALVAKHVFGQMSEQQRWAVRADIQIILFRDGQMTRDGAAWLIEGMDERAFFGFAALAMMEMGIAPPDNVWRWVSVHNPFAALIDAATEIQMARRGLEKRGIKVSLEETKVTVAVRKVTAKELGEELAVAAYQGMQALVEDLKAFPPKGDHAEVFKTLSPYIETLYFTLFSYNSALIRHYLNVDKAMLVEYPMAQHALKMLIEGTGVTEPLFLTIKGLPFWALRVSDYSRIKMGEVDDLKFPDGSAFPDNIRHSYLCRTAVKLALDLPQLPGMFDIPVPTFQGYFEDTVNLVPSQLKTVRLVEGDVSKH